MANSEKKQINQKKRKKISASYLENSGAYYLNRYASTVANFRKIMIRKIDRSFEDHPEQDRDKCLKALEDVIEKFIRLGFLDDDRYATEKIRTLRQQGKSGRFIFQKLMEKGLDKNFITEQLDISDSRLEQDFEESLNIDFLSAIRLCQKRRIGPFRGYDMLAITDKDEKANLWNKELAKLARAGFDFPTSKNALTLTREKAEDYIKTLESRL